MKLIQSGISKDYGSDFWIKILSTKHWSFIQVQVGWFDYPTWPFIQIKSGGGYGLSILFALYKFSFDVDFLSRTWYNE